MHRTLLIGMFHPSTARCLPELSVCCSVRVLGAATNTLQYVCMCYLQRVEPFGTSAAAANALATRSQLAAWLHTRLVRLGCACTALRVHVLRFLTAHVLLLPPLATSADRCVLHRLKVTSGGGAASYH